MTSTTLLRPLLTACAFILALAACRSSNPLALQASDLDVYSAGPFSVQQILLAEGEAGNPKEIRLFVPEASGRYPLLQFQHGFISDVDTYTDLLSQLASHGFVIAAPQMYVGDPSTAPSVSAETADAVAALAWVKQNVNEILGARVSSPLSVRAQTTDTGLLGHSRGGQVAWRMLFDHGPPYVARAIAGVDPVDGDAPPFPPGETGEMVTDDDPNGFQFPFSSLILGMGMGAEGAPGFECAPANRNYTFFYEASAAPRYELVATGFGHSDMLNGEEPDAVCPGDTSGSRGELRRAVAGQLAAYFSIELKRLDLRHVLRDPSLAPVATTGRYED